MADVFVGFYFDEEKEKELLTLHKSVGIAANQYQKGFLAGLSGDTKILTALSVGTFPRRNKRLLFHKEIRQVAEGEITYLPFVNLYGVRDLMFRSGLYRSLKKIIRSQDHTNVYVYSLNMWTLPVMRRLKRQFGDKFHYSLIIPDLPGQYGVVRKGIKGIKDRLEVEPKMTLPAWADSFVFLTEAMRELFPKKPYKVVEGFLPAGNFDYSTPRIPKTILYTGTLHPAFGLQTLMDAFSMIDDPEYQLWICGGGVMEKDFQNAAQKDSRIQFKGFLPKAQITDLQTRCDILINPRTAEGEFTKYSFPSKTMEYLLSGSKVVMYRLPGIGQEYYRFIRTIDQLGPQAMKEAIMEACNDTEFYQSGWQEQVTWIQTEKSAAQQVGKPLCEQ